MAVNLNKGINLKKKTRKEMVYTCTIPKSRLVKSK